MSDYATAAAKVDQLQARLSAYVAPLSVGTPVVSGVGAIGNTLTCSRGIWDNGVASYAYQWKSAAVNVGTSIPTYAPVAGDITKAITCVVTATNTFGATAAPASNGVTIVA